MKTEDPDRGMRQHFGRHGKTCGWVVVFKVIKKGSWVIMVSNQVLTGSDGSRSVLVSPGAWSCLVSVQRVSVLGLGGASAAAAREQSRKVAPASHGNTARVAEYSIEDNNTNTKHYLKC